MQKSEVHVKINSPAKLLSIVPPLLGFVPESGSLVVIGLVPPENKVRVSLRYDLPGPGDATEVAAHIASIFTLHEMTVAVAIGYGPGSPITPMADVLRRVLQKAGVTLLDFLRVDEGRYWSYLCKDVQCCPPQGTPFEISDEGLGHVLTNREAVAKTIAPVTGDAAKAMQDAIVRVVMTGKDDIRGVIAKGLAEVREAIEDYRNGGEPQLSDDQAAAILVALTDLRVRDDAWARMDPEFAADHLRLWTDLTGRARPRFVAAVASLLAFVAWQRGNGALANVALDRALEDNPQYSMAELLRQAITAGAPPSLARLPVTPEEVAASYVDLERKKG